MRDVQRMLRADGRWTGGRVPFGKRAVCRCHELATRPDTRNCQGWELRLHESNAALLRDAARRVVQGRRPVSSAGRYWCPGEESDPCEVQPLLANKMRINPLIFPAGTGALNLPDARQDD